MNPEVVGLVASVFLSVAGLPQVIKSYRTKKVEDISTILGYGVLSTPALVVDGVVKFSGKVPSVKELKDILAQ